MLLVGVREEPERLIRRLLEEEGYEVIYGDTDSVFVSLNGRHDNEAAGTIGTNMLIAAALIEGATLFAVVVGFLGVTAS